MAIPSTKRGLVAGYGIAVLGVAFTIVVAIVLPSRTVEAGCRLDCLSQVNGVKIALIVLGLLIALAGVLVGAFRSYLAKS
jgi:hypothetical protein